MSIFSSKPILYLVTDRFHFSEEEFFDIVLAAVRGGVHLVQLREKNLSDKEVVRLGKRLKQLLIPYSVPLIINDRPDLALAIGADGVHLGQSDGDVLHARQLLGEGAIIGLSLNDDAHLNLVNNLPVDYVAASPVFLTSTKPDAMKPWGILGLKALCHRVNKPVIAIGGLSIDNLSSVLSANIAGIACVSALMLAPAPEEAAKAFLYKMTLD